MDNHRKLRGFRILNRARSGRLSITLFTQNGERYLVLVNRRWLGMITRNRCYQFEDEMMARHCYEKLIKATKARASLRVVN